MGAFASNLVVSCAPIAIRVVQTFWPQLTSMGGAQEFFRQGWATPDYLGVGIGIADLYLQGGLSGTGVANAFLHCGCAEWTTEPAMAPAGGVP